MFFKIGNLKKSTSNSHGNNSSFFIKAAGLDVFTKERTPSPSFPVHFSLFFFQDNYHIEHLISADSVKYLPSSPRMLEVVFLARYLNLIHQLCNILSTSENVTRKDKLSNNKYFSKIKFSGWFIRSRNLLIKYSTKYVHNQLSCEHC